MVWLCLIACMRNQRVSDKVLTQLTSTGIIPMKGRSLLLTILMVCAQQLGLLVVGLWFSSSRELTGCDQDREISSRANSRFVVSVGTCLIGRWDPLIAAWISWQEQFSGGTCQGRGECGNGEQLAADGSPARQLQLQVLILQSTSRRPSSHASFKMLLPLFL